MAIFCWNRSLKAIGAVIKRRNYEDKILNMYAVNSVYNNFGYNEFLVIPKTFSCPDLYLYPHRILYAYFEFRFNRYNEDI